MPQALKTLCLIHIFGWKNPTFPLLALWGNKNWPPSMKVKKLKIFWDKMGSKGCKWSSLNAPGTQTPLSHPILKLDEFPFLHISPLGKVQLFLARLLGCKKMDRTAVAVRQRLVGRYCLFLLLQHNKRRSCKSAKQERAFSESNAAALLRSIFDNPVSANQE